MGRSLKIRRWLMCVRRPFCTSRRDDFIRRRERELRQSLPRGDRGNPSVAGVLTSQTLPDSARETPARSRTSGGAEAALFWELARWVAHARVLKLWAWGYHMDWAKRVQAVAPPSCKPGEAPERQVKTTLLQRVASRSSWSLCTQSHDGAVSIVPGPQRCARGRPQQPLWDWRTVGIRTYISIYRERDV